MELTSKNWGRKNQLDPEPTITNNLDLMHSHEACAIASQITMFNAYTVDLGEPCSSTIGILPSLQMQK